MKIGILTHPQGANYGGLLQCYALCTYLRKLGHEPIVIQRVANKSFFLWGWTRAILKALHFPRYYNPNEIDRTINIRPFIEKHIARTEPIDTQSKMKRICNTHGLEAVIVGSDQVWRHDYSMKYGYNYFLDFVPENVIKASYAASLGLSEWYYTPKQTKKISELLNMFKGISVREEDAVSLLKKNVQINAIQLLDPTMLLTESDYDLITSPRIVDKQYVFVYWLGDKSNITGEIEHYKAKDLKVIDLNLKDNIEQISVEDWLSYIKYADYVITDSFHGSLFSILFEKQFEVFQNHSGGIGRISSLCKMLNLEETTKIDYNNVNTRLDALRRISFQYFNSIFEV